MAVQFEYPDHRVWIISCQQTGEIAYVSNFKSHAVHQANKMVPGNKLELVAEGYDSRVWLIDDGSEQPKWILTLSPLE